MKDRKANSYCLDGEKKINRSIWHSLALKGEKQFQKLDLKIGKQTGGNINSSISFLFEMKGKINLSNQSKGVIYGHH